MTNKFKLTISRAGRDIKIYNAGEDEDFAGAYQYGLEENVKSDYLNFPTINGNYNYIENAVVCKNNKKYNYY